jgi:phosphosulfolactate synthase
VGFKDPGRSAELTPQAWVEAIHIDLEAGASLVITEARESGRSGLCRPDGTPRPELVDAILGSGLDADRLLFEAPTKELQTHFISLLGSNVNLGNIAPSDVIGLETLRLGLRADTLMHFEGMRSCA